MLFDFFFRKRFSKARSLTNTFFQLLNTIMTLSNPWYLHCMTHKLGSQYVLQNIIDFKVFIT